MQNGVDSWHKAVTPSTSQSLKSNGHMPQYSAIDNGTALWRQSLRSPSPDQNSLNAFLNQVASIQTKSAEPSYHEVNSWKPMHQVCYFYFRFVLSKSKNHFCFSYMLNYHEIKSFARI